MIERVSLGWRIWVQLHPKYKLSANFFSAQYSKFFIFQTQGFINRILIHKEYFPNFPFVTSRDGSENCERVFRDLKGKYGVYSVKEMCDEIRIRANENSLICKTTGLLHKNKAKEETTTKSFQIPTNEEIKRIFLEGRNFGDTILEWLGMRTRLEDYGCWQTPPPPGWKTVGRPFNNNASNQHEGQQDDEEEFDDEENVPEAFEDPLETLKGLHEAIAQDLDNLARKADHLDTDDESGDSLFSDAFPLGRNEASSLRIDDDANLSMDMDNSSEIDNISENKMSEQYSWPTVNKYWEEMENKDDFTEILELLSVGSASSQLKTLTHIVEKYKTSHKIPPIIYGEKALQKL